MKKFILIFLQFLLVTSIFAQAPPNYYSTAAGKTGTDLQEALHNIIKNHISVSYNSLPSWFQTTDKKTNGTVWDMYSDVPGGNPPYTYQFGQDECGNYNGEGDCFNREHSWPKSWFGGEVMPMYSDMFQLYPTDGYVNNRRDNYPYGEVNSATWTSLNGCKLGSCITSGYSGTVFEPIDEYKGDFARTYFYMSTRYYLEDSGWPGSAMVTGAQLKPWAMAMMLRWNSEDPVSTKETNRNNAVYGIQENRNPFIDNSEFVDLIWGFPAGTGTANAFIVKVWPNPASVKCFIASPFKDSPVEIIIVNPQGIIFAPKARAEGKTIEMDLSGLPSGIYLITLKSETALFHTRVIKQNMQ